MFNIIRNFVTNWIINPVKAAYNYLFGGEVISVSEAKKETDKVEPKVELPAESKKVDATLSATMAKLEATKPAPKAAPKAEAKREDMRPALVAHKEAAAKEMTVETVSAEVAKDAALVKPEVINAMDVEAIRKEIAIAVRRLDFVIKGEDVPDEYWIARVGISLFDTEKENDTISTVIGLANRALCMANDEEKIAIHKASVKALLTLDAMLEAGKRAEVVAIFNNNSWVFGNNCDLTLPYEDTFTTSVKATEETAK